jgi:hypothetical protein
MAFYGDRFMLMLLRNCQFHLNLPPQKKTIGHNTCLWPPQLPRAVRHACCFQTHLYMAVLCVTAIGRLATSCWFVYRIIVAHGRRQTVIVSSSKNYVQPISHLPAPNGFRYNGPEVSEDARTAFCLTVYIYGGGVCHQSQKYFQTF